MGGRVYFSRLTVCTAGVATLFSTDLWPEVLGVAEAVPGHLLHLWVHLEGLVVNLVNIYAPTLGAEQLRFFQQASAFLGTLDPHECLVLGGDFNTTLEERDRSGTEQCPAVVDVLREIVDHHSLVDVWHDHHPDDASTFTFVQFSEALLHMPTNKSPGMDGLTVEFYRMFWDILGPDLVTVWAESLQSGVLSLSCRRAVLALLPKKGDLRDLRNWRPVSLLSTDYKVVAKAISLWLGSVLTDVIHPDQTYTIPGRTIFDNLYLVQDLLELGCRDGLSFCLLSLDQEKAFNRVDHGYLLGTLQAFGLGPQFVGFLQVLYISAECLVRLNRTLTEPVSFGRGVRQGCPLSGQQYVLGIEPFLCLLRRRLTGLTLRELELQLVLSAYADDVLLVVQDPGDLARVEACQAVYSAASSARVKSSGLVNETADQPSYSMESKCISPDIVLLNL
ncbi:unnamed protein product [Caretta caretta]